MKHPVTYHESLIKALRCEMIEYLLKLLESSMERIEKPSSVKAQIVKAIKAMLNSTNYLSQVCL